MAKADARGRIGIWINVGIEMVVMASVIDHGEVWAPSISLAFAIQNQG